MARAVTCHRIEEAECVCKLVRKRNNFSVYRSIPPPHANGDREAKRLPDGMKMLRKEYLSDTSYQGTMLSRQTGSVSFSEQPEGQRARKLARKRGWQSCAQGWRAEGCQRAGKAARSSDQMYRTEKKSFTECGQLLQKNEGCWGKSFFIEHPALAERLNHCSRCSCRAPFYATAFAEWLPSLFLKRIGVHEETVS